MASIETYRTRIDALKTSVETLKRGGPFIIQNLPGRAPLIVNYWDDLDLPIGTVIAGNEDHVYLRALHGDTYWESSSPDIEELDGYDLDGFYEHLRERAAAGEQFRIAYQPDA
jgi:hypothetical protein|nr:MAG TPA: hypothetical protein [Caudoviricetes sp.]